VRRGGEAWKRRLGRLAYRSPFISAEPAFSAPSPMPVATPALSANHLHIFEPMQNGHRLRVGVRDDCHCLLALLCGHCRAASRAWLPDDASCRGALAGRWGVTASDGFDAGELWLPAASSARRASVGVGGSLPLSYGALSPQNCLRRFPMA